MSVLPANVLLDTPTGRVVLRGRVDARLCDTLPATESDVLGGRAFRGGDGELWTYKAISGDSRDELLDKARARGFRWVRGGGPMGRLAPPEEEREL